MVDGRDFTQGPPSKPSELLGLSTAKLNTFRSALGDFVLTNARHFVL